MANPKFDDEKLQQLKAFLRLKPTLEDTAHFFDVDARTIERVIRKHFNKTFVEFRQQNMVHTRHSLIRKAIEKAKNGDNVMLIFCLKNLCGWKDKIETELKAVEPYIIERSNGDKIELGAKEND